ncbi:23S rRNA pseudouridine(1911/1915/1917) synthase RluD [Thiorhodococcus mannitoliphagus]|uniref:Pseudouridine synthase n=1 Tax=Thiorhodococcus mannitoliphagus TaxID=329406 RepID=A0A6P1DWR7_9GAMM|nr:23S rRNA pseudouridine(1911/1915/1917) synthase RluD [Thiorhodococcus mannitoliphagus]NEX22757.1 23S rRNA pseudouridine(1911/1915/1917) synthase RluD [Thiorhodococcus mannitoliphagus]
MNRLPRDRVQRHLQIDSTLAGRRLDQALATLMPEFSRSRLQQWIDAGQILVDDGPRRSRDKVWGGESVRVQAELEAQGDCLAQAIALNLVYEDEQLLVVDKPAGLVVHPAAGNPDGTLQNALLHHEPALAAVPRAGIVHRLDKDTSGLLVVAKTLQAHNSLVNQLQARAVHREYRALVQGHLVAGGSVDAPIGRHPTQRVKMAVVRNGREAVTHYRILESFASHSLLSVELETGRTHQIRVHMAHIRHALVGDPLYGGRPRPPQGCSPQLRSALQQFPRQALHAIRLGLIHPQSGEAMSWQVPMARDLDALLDLLRSDVGHADPHP